MKALFDLFPLLIFFGSYAMVDIFFATGAMMAATTLQVAWAWFKHRKVEKMLLTINPYGAPVEHWHTDALFRERVLLEWRKIEPYKARGYIADWP